MIEVSDNAIIPNGWEVVYFNEILKAVKREETWDDNKLYQLLSVRRRSEGPFHREDLYGHQIKTKNLQPVKEGDFVISKMQIVHGASALVTRQFDGFYVSGSYLILHAKNELKLDAKYLAFLSSTPWFYRLCLASSYGVHIEKMTFNFNLFLKSQLALPPLLEQQKIAEILSAMDEKIAVINEQLAQTQELKKGLMQRLLAKGIGHTAFKDSPLGEIPETWEVRHLEQLVDAKRNIRYGIVQTGENLAEGVPCLRVADFNSRVFKLDSMIRTSPVISAGYPSTVLKANDIVFPLRGRIGEVRLVSEDIAGINLTRGIALISNSDKIEPEYLLWQLLSPMVHKEIMLKVNGTTLQEIPITGLKKVLIPVAPKGEQLQIATILSTVEEKISVLADKKNQYQELKRGLMQQLLTGQRRVKLRQEEAVLA